uniref:Calcium channel YVC1-like C-terminal transmembrane domain-containing protein n=1 Tax=Fusarium oxysporum (strain Fo5176) TaxID=660025 RepID=A0A0D2XW95_FUSOF
MFSSLLRRPRAGPRRIDRRRNTSFSPSPGPARRRYTLERHATADFTEADDDDGDDTHDEGLSRFRSNERRTNNDGDEEDDEDDEGEEEDRPGEDGRRGGLPVLPLFSASHLDSLPVYSITHAIRIIVSTRTETTLSWDQLRSPQVSQFLVKPMQQQIRAQHFSRATLYALMINCLQFTKEGERYPGNAGISSTRAKVCELLTLKLLKEYNVRELIDALAYDFYPLQGLPGSQAPTSPRKSPPANKLPLIASRTSTLEVAIRASAKHLLAHPLVVQQLEAIWSGAITFHSSADSLHREPPPAAGLNSNGYIGKATDRTPLLGAIAQKETRFTPPGRRLELIFWFWSAGFMLDELVGFNEQGFALYILNVWNVFDLGILLLLIVYYCMRAYGVFLADSHHIYDNAYDILAANAILLLPRIFSILDHYQYFSQLLIAFRLMAVDLVAVFTLILVLCSGWDAYNWLGRALLVLFLSICHFLVVTILITVLTNSFMAIASNANEEHQTVIKVTHFPVLFCIYLYERYWLAPSMYEATDLVEHPVRERSRHISFMDPVSRAAIFSPSIRVREESVAGFQKDRALEEVFRRLPDPLTLRTQRRQERRKTQTAIRNWMDQHDDNDASPGNWQTPDGAMPPWQRRSSVGLARTTNLRRVSDVRSTASDPADRMSNVGNPLRPSHFSRTRLTADLSEYKDQTDADGDDELVTNDEDEDDHVTNAGQSQAAISRGIHEEAESYFAPNANNFGKLASSVSSSGKRSSSGKNVSQTPRPKRGAHNRTLSTNTILFNPQDVKQMQRASSISPPLPGQSRPRTSGRITTGEKTPRRSSPRRSMYVANTKPRPVMPPRGMTEAGAVSRSALLSIEPRNRPKDIRRLSSVDLSAMSDQVVGDHIGAMPGSFQTQLATFMKDNRLRAGGGNDSGDRDRMGRLVLARMKTLEESFADVIKEMRDLKNSSTVPTTRRNSGDEANMAPMIEVAGRDRLRKYHIDNSQRKVASKRPVSRRSLKEEKPGMWDYKGKGKEVVYESDDEAETDDSLFKKGGSL